MYLVARISYGKEVLHTLACKLQRDLYIENMLKFFMVFKGRSATCHSRDNESFTCNFIQKKYCSTLWIHSDIIWL